jgi:hypothetical protein
MPGNSPFRLNRSGLLLALISAAFAGQAQAAAGRVEFAIGPVSIVGADGRTRSASRGVELDTGDTVRTNQGRLQMRMSDGAYISLQPNTEFGIKDYKFEGKTDGSENAFYSLLKGAMRTVTGLIGRVNRNKYLVSTPTATVGIRGTGGVIEVLQDGGTLVQGTSGIWFLANPAGTIDIPAGVSGVAPADPKQPPQETVDIPSAGPSPLPPPPPFVQGDSPKLLSGDGYTAALAYGVQSEGLFAQRNIGNSSATFNGTGQMTAFAFESGYAISPGGTHADFGTDGILAWGRWVGEVSVQGSTETYDSNQGLHYVVGLPTASMPQSGSATYALLGATSPTYIDGTAAPGTFSGALTVNFGLRSTGVVMDLNVGIDGKSYSITGNAPISGSTFSGFSGSILTGGTNGACVQGCSAGVNGFFAGPVAERAGLAYHIQDFFTNKDVVGAAGFAKQ